MLKGHSGGGGGASGRGGHRSTGGFEGAGRKGRRLIPVSGEVRSGERSNWRSGLERLGG